MSRTATRAARRAGPANRNTQSQSTPTSVMERTLAIIKPDAYEKRLDILQHIKRSGFNVVVKKTKTLKQHEAARFYEEHCEKQFYEGLIEYLTSGPVMALVLSKRKAISAWRARIGPTNRLAALAQAPKSLRAMFGTSEFQNGLHGSDSYTSAEREIKFFFPKLETKPQGEQIRNYLAVEVNHILAKTLMELYGARPTDPLLWLAKRLGEVAVEEKSKNKNKNQETRAKKVTKA